MQLSVVTINFNNKEGLEKTLSSVFGQSFSDFEFIIIDGGSADGSLEIIKHNSENINYWVSEKDNGIYDAMNKGIAKATGDYLLFLNSGDHLLDSLVLQKCADFMNQFPVEDIYYGDMFFINDPHATGKKKRHWKHPEKLTLPFFKRSTINHQASIIKASLFKEFGFYPEAYKLAADYWLYLISLLNNKKFKHFGFTMVDYGLSGASSNNFSSYIAEKQIIWETLVPACVKDLVIENEEYKHLTGYKIVRAGIKINSVLQRVKNKKV
jgi:glycosyltransferase involved in cell wall biosynthesis